MHTGKVLFSGADQYDMLRRMIHVLGMPPREVLMQSPASARREFFDEYVITENGVRVIDFRLKVRKPVPLKYDGRVSRLFWFFQLQLMLTIVCIFSLLMRLLVWPKSSEQIRVDLTEIDRTSAIIHGKITICFSIYCRECWITSKSMAVNCLWRVSVSSPEFRAALKPGLLPQKYCSIRFWPASSTYVGFKQHLSC